MERVKQFNFWVGILVSIVLLIESGYGLYTYYQRSQRSFQSGTFSQNMPNTFSNSGNSTSGSNASQSGSSNFQGGGRAFGEMGGARNFQSGPFGLAVDVAGLILAIIALVLTGIVGRNNLKKRKKQIDPSKTAHD